jgi:hypothetical protein
MNGMQMLDLARAIACDRERSVARGVAAETATFVRPRHGRRMWRTQRVS